jgi:hypothetical protein
LNINPTAAGGAGGAIQQAVGAVADAAPQFTMKAKSTSKVGPIMINMPDGTQVPASQNITPDRLLRPDILESLHPDERAKVLRLQKTNQNLRGTQTTQAGAAASGAASAAGGAADSSVSGISKADRFKSHNTTGITGPAAIGILGTGAAGMLGAQYLANRQGPGPAPAPTPGPGPMPPVMPGMKGQDFKANQLAERSQADQMQDAQLAQNFIQVRKGLPNFTTAQDFYYAAQAAGMTPGQMNQVAALAKAEGFRDKTPMMN